MSATPNTGLPTRIGVILINVGTPASTEPSAVGRYLREFLMDPLVVDLPAPLRWFFVNALIVPRRKTQSAALYRKVWTDQGSPLLVHSRALGRALQASLGDPYRVVVAMRYGEPSLESAVKELKALGVAECIAFPLYPQFSLAATQSAVDEFRRLANLHLAGCRIAIVDSFYSSPEYLGAVAEVSRPHLEVGDYDRVLFSFHGLPQLQVMKTDPSGKHCLKHDHCCSKIVSSNSRCYRAQSFHTASELARRLNLPKEKWEVGFQSRLGRTPWIRPFSDVLYRALPSQGVRRLVVLTPSFVADCLETLEEVQIRGKQSFVEAGGESLRLVPSLNDHPAWVQAVGKLVQNARVTNYQPKT